jgi:flagellar biosynthesis/type III secretory pathway chaperone
MSEPEPTVSAETLRDGLRKAKALEALLGEEFELLSAGDLNGFESLQNRKTETLEALTSLVPLLTGDIEAGDSEDVPANSEVIEDIKAVLATCRDAHLKNAILIDRKIEATRSALEVLRSSRSADTGETYDKLGKIKRGYSQGRRTDV